MQELIKIQRGLLLEIDTELSALAHGKAACAPIRARDLLHRLRAQYEYGQYTDETESAGVSQIAVSAATGPLVEGEH